MTLINNAKTTKGEAEDYLGAINIYRGSEGKASYMLNLGNNRSASCFACLILEKKHLVP
jgi:hypothetical protein